MEQEAPERSKHCRNCQAAMSEEALHCERCGQKYTTGKVSLWGLFSELIESVFNIDSKIFRTIGALFIPGKLTVEYFKGRHKSYVHPVRLFFITAISFFAILTVLVFRQADGEFESINKQMFRRAYQAEFLDMMDGAKDSVRLRYPQHPVVGEALDSLNNFIPDARRDSTTFVYFKLNENWELKENKLRLPRYEMVELEMDSLFRKYEVEGVLAQTQVRQNIKLQLEIGNFLRYLMGQLVWLVVIMMPILALILKLLYIRRKNYYIEHLVFSFHYHAFAFFLFAINFSLLALPWSLADTNLLKNYLPGMISIWIAIYLYLAMRRVYQQRRGKTLLKYFILNFFYLFVFLLVASLVTAVSAMLY